MESLLLTAILNGSMAYSLLSVGATWYNGYGSFIVIG